MAKVKMLLDPVSNTLNIWWADPSEASSSEETDSPYRNDVVIKNSDGVPIGIEIIGVFPEELNIAKLVKDKLPPGKNEPFLMETGN